MIFLFILVIGSLPRQKEHSLPSATLCVSSVRDSATCRLGLYSRLLSKRHMVAVLGAVDDEFPVLNKDR